MRCTRCAFNSPICYSVLLEQCDLFVFQVHTQYIQGIHHDLSHLPSVLCLQVLYNRNNYYIFSISYLNFYISITKFVLIRIHNCGYTHLRSKANHLRNP